MNPVTMKLVVDDLILQALREDITFEDVSTASVCPTARPATVELIAKADGIIAGLDVFARTFELLDPQSSVLFDVADGDIDKAIDGEREILEPLHEQADYYIDTSLMSTSTLKENVLNIFLDTPSDSMTISCISFGFKYGVPNEADLVFDVRCLPNPYYIPELKEKTGLDKEVRDYVMSFESSQTLQIKLFDLIDFLIPQYLHEGKSQLVIAFGCTGGKHRSATFAENMCEHLSKNHLKARVLHRDVNKDKK